MLTKSRKRWVIAVAALAGVAMALTDASQADAARRLAALRAARAAELEALSAPAPAALVAPPVMAVPGAYVAPVTGCCPQPCIIYRHHGPKLCCGCEPPIPTLLTVNNPCTGCPVDVSVCLPVCCTGAPSVGCHKGLLGRSVVTYDWCCGFRVTVRFLHNGKVIVATHGV
jgi:hypothetical protein